MGASNTDTSAQEQSAGSPPVAAPVRTPLKENPGPFKIDQKRYDPLFRPFHRLNSPTYDSKLDDGPTPGKSGPTGLGRDCGCRHKDDFKSSILTGAVVGAILDGLDSALNKALPGSSDLRKFLEKQFGGKDTDLKKSLTDFLSTFFEKGLFGDFLKFIPNWVPVNRIGFGPTFDKEDAHNVDKDGNEVEVEVQGRLSRSYSTHHHRPYTQWSNYYHWAFHVVPMPGFEHMVRRGNLRSVVDNDLESDNAQNQPALLIYEDSINQKRNADFECLLDVGAFSTPPGDSGVVFNHPAIFYEKSWPFWPQSGDWFWAVGRYVYDCSHVTLDPVIDPDTKKVTETLEKHPALINPTKAFATARYEAVIFDEADEPLPATRFSFFSCRKGGYWDFDDGKHLPFGKTNYEFAIDLPPAPSGSVEFEVGQASDFKLNTLVIRPRLVQKIEFAPYDAKGATVQFHTEPPKVEIVRPADGSLPRMVKLTVPMDSVPKNKDGYGFTISFAWLAPGVPTGVKKVSVKLASLTLLRESEDLRISVSVNGRSVFIPTAPQTGEDLTSPSDFMQGFPGDEGIVLLLPPEKGVRITMSGWHRGDFGAFLEKNRMVDPRFPGKKVATRTDDRRLQVGGVINVSEKLEALIKAAVETKLSDIVPKELLGRFKKIEEAVDNEEVRKLVQKAVDDLLGKRRMVDWDEDVDFQESDKAHENEIACAVAREMSVFPVEPFSSFNKPMGFVELLGYHGSAPEDQAAVLNVAAMQARLDTQKNAITTVQFRSKPALQASESEFIVFEANTKDDYILKITATISDPDPPK
jgi:hypothetical protein